MADHNEGDVPPTLHELDQMVFQILQAHGTIASTKLIQLISQLKCPEFDATDQSIGALFRRINANVKTFGLEVKSVVLREETDADDALTTVAYHGVVNTEDDKYSKDFGSDFNALELKYFSAVLSKLLEEKFLSTKELVELCPRETLSAPQAGMFLRKLQQQGWLLRDDHNNFVIGSRSFLELRGFLENAIRKAATGGEGAAREWDALTVEERQEAEAEINALPQIIMY